MVVGMVLVDPSVPDQAATFDRVAPALAGWERAHQPPSIAYLHKCSAGLRDGTVKHGGPDPDGCTHSPRPATFPPELRAALDKEQVEAGPKILAAILDNVAYYQSGQAVELDSKSVAKSGRNYGAMPLVVLTAGMEDPAPPNLPPAALAQLPLRRTELLHAHQALAALSTRGVNRVVADSPSLIQQSKPQVVVSAINEVLDQALTFQAKTAAH
jgi:hypothetical protein